MLIRLGLLLSFMAVVSAIYPDDHWNYSTRIENTEMLESLIAETIEADKTLFVRWIASPNWGWWRKQSPSWNQVTKAFAGNKDVVFADVNLKEVPIRGEPYNPGLGGWPTVRHFNKATGKDGEHYEKKTEKPMCQELLDWEYMQGYIESAGKTALEAGQAKVEQEL